MSLTTGTRLGPYEIVALLGAGGMGEVYKALDTRLSPTVAIKVLPERTSTDTQARERFDREAKIISNLDHPHICALYDVGSEEGIDFLVMPFLEGETLAARLTKGPLPLEQVFRFGIEIADALNKAHREGIIHRDLKPGNVMVTKAGTKLLDFGLAKLRPSSRATAAALSQVPTDVSNLTNQGTMSLTGDRKPQPILQTRFDEEYPELSPDGRWLAYASNESGRTEVYVQRYPGPGPKVPVSTDGGNAPAWRRDGRELFFLAAGGSAESPQLRIMAVNVTTQPTFAAEKPRMLFQGSFQPGANARGYDVSPDGQRFLMVLPKERPPITPASIVLVLNWFTEL